MSVFSQSAFYITWTVAVSRDGYILAADLNLFSFGIFLFDFLDAHKIILDYHQIILKAKSFQNWIVKFHLIISLNYIMTLSAV